MLEILKKIGLSKPEIDIYKGLLELGRSKSKELCEHTKVHNSKVYFILNSLIDKGLVTFTTKNNIKYFEATPVDSIKTLVENKKEELNHTEKQIFDIIEHLKKIKTKDKDQAKYNYYEGISGIKAGIHKLKEDLDENSDSILKIMSSSSKENQRLLGFYDEFHKEMHRKKIRYNLIIGKDLPEHAKKRSKQPFTEVRVKEKVGEIGIIVYSNLVIIQSAASKEPFMIIINEPLVAKTFEMLFDDIWNSLPEFK